MYCPKCRSEFREGFFECPECSVPLVEDLPPEEPEPIPEYVDFEEIKTSLDMGEIAIIKSILDSHKIKYIIHNEFIGSTYGAALPARILVSENQVKEAKELLQDFL
jgi:hypothetical protein